MSKAEERLIELAEDRLRVAEELGLSVAGVIARIYEKVESGEYDDACSHLDDLDEAINKARQGRSEAVRSEGR